MTMDRELRSSKRQRVGPTSTDVSVVHSDLPGQVADIQMPDSKTHKNMPSMDSANGGENDGIKISLEGSEDNKRQVHGILGGNQSDVTNDVMHASLVTGRSKGSHDGSKDLPEHNEKLASTLLSLKETDVPAPKCESLLKTRKNRSLHSNASAAVKHYVDAETYNENSYVNEMQQIEMDLLQKLKKYINARGGTIGDEWKVQATKRNKIIYKSYHSPDGRRFRSMKEVARFVGILPKKENPTGIEEDSDKTRTNDASSSRFLNSKFSQMQQLNEKLEVDQIPRKSASMAKGPGRQQEVSGPRVVVEDKTKQARLHLESEIQPSSGLSTLGLKEKRTLDIAKASGEVNDTNKRQHMHWTELLEQVLKTPNMTVGRIRSQILKVLTSEPPEWVKQKLHPSIALDVLETSGSGPVKEVVSSVLEQYRGEEASCKLLAKETFYKHPGNGCETGNSNEGKVEIGSRRKIRRQKTFPSSDAITKQCQNVLQDITSAEKFAQLCNLIHGSFSGSRTHEVFDFRLIELRMNAGTYGMSPALFDSDIQQNWKRVREIGQEMIFLADSLSHYSQDSYKNQVSTLLEEEPVVNSDIDHTDASVRTFTNGVEVYKDILDEQARETIVHCHSSGHDSKITEIPRVEVDHNPPCISSKNVVDDYSGKEVGGVGVELKDIPGNAHLSSKETSMENIEGCMNLEHKQDYLPNVREADSSGNQVQCTSCGKNECNDVITVCNKCHDAYHIYCLSPPLDAIPRTSWYCSCCSTIRKESYEVHSLCNGKDSVVKEGTNNAVHGCLASDLDGGLMEMNNAQENGKLDTSREQIESQSNMREFEPKVSSKVIGIPKDREEIGLHINQTGSSIHAHVQESDLHINQTESLTKTSVQESELHVNQTESLIHASVQESELHDDKQVITKVCKICTTGTRDDDHLIQCSNENCPYKFYHLRCLRPPLASVPPPTWYCPSCLCRSCFMDENDSNIVLCDGCDDAYHTYCLKPPLVVIPESNWYCPSCLEKHKRKKGKRVLNSTASGSKSTGRSRSKKASQVQSQSSLHMDGTADLPERAVSSVGYVRLKNSSQIRSPSGSYTQRGPHNPFDNIMKGEIENSVQHEESQKVSQLEKCPLEEEAGEAPSDNSLDGVTENFIVRVRPRHTTKYKATAESKDAGKRKRKCSEPKRSEV